VLAGAALGGAVALGTRRFWPVASREPAAIRRAAVRVDTTALPEGKGMTIVVNPSAGPALADNPAGELRKALPEAEILELSDDLPLDEALERAAKASVIGIAGGDGSVNAAAQVAIEHGVPLAVVPAGTLNHLARDLGLDSVDEAIDAVRNGHAAAVDVGTIDGRPFLNTASFGSYVELVDAREKLESRIGKWPAVVVALIRVLRRSDPVDVEIDGEPRRIWMIFIGNCRYRPSGFAPSWRERLDDGLLDVRTVDADEPWGRTRLVFALLSGRLGRCRVYRQRVTDRIGFRSPDGTPIRLARDGETFDGSPEFVATKLPTPLPIYVPRANGS
jgi:undecaprenyl-diphosphatase